MNNKEYQKEYMKQYKRKNKILTFPIDKMLYENLYKKSNYYDISVNTFAKNIVINFLNNDSNKFLSKDKLDFIKQYIRISRSIANNINQIARNTNIGENIDIQILIDHLKNYEDEFKKFIKEQG